MQTVLLLHPLRMLLGCLNYVGVLFRYCLGERTHGRHVFVLRQGVPTADLQSTRLHQPDAS